MATSLRVAVGVVAGSVAALVVAAARRLGTDTFGGGTFGGF